MYEIRRVGSAFIFISSFIFFEKRQLRSLHSHGPVEYSQACYRQKVGWRSVCVLTSDERHGVDLVNHADNFTASESNAECEAALQAISSLRWVPLTASNR